MDLIRKIYSFLIDTIQSLLIAAAVFLVVYVFLFKPFEVKGESMYPNFHNNSYVLTSIIGLRFNSPKRGDVVVFKAPPDPEKQYIKRVVGLPGETIEVNKGRVLINGEILNESSYLSKSVQTSGGAFLKEGEKVTVPPGNYFVMGDNRNFSSDSRDWGFVSSDKLTGYSFFVYWPLNEAGSVANPFTR